ncbi:hypothetical protein [Mucilaginibacter sp. dw_454]|uniref:hypothetical protein n=1 Tax=Mucilaginibacter sp. dw_454 TaxID=2720079 RepID=UPI001BD46ACA|nr:hypothetical protein [Mucilaginibacter sp. dw_454]
MKNKETTIRQMKSDIQEALVQELEHARNFLLIQEEDIELIKQRLQVLTPAGR